MGQLNLIVQIYVSCIYFDKLYLAWVDVIKYFNYLMTLSPRKGWFKDKIKNTSCQETSKLTRVYMYIQVSLTVGDRYANMLYSIEV
jgi:hypothetical protein